jgi:hypothetical protein
MSEFFHGSPSTFVAALADVRLSSVFNPYADVCGYYDLPHAPQLRRQNLENVFQTALDLKADTMWIARDLAHRGGRRTGLPLTDEPQSLTRLIKKVRFYHQLAN